MSLFTILPSVPVPFTNFKLIPLSSASFLARGDALEPEFEIDSAGGKKLFGLEDVSIKGGDSTGVSFKGSALVTNFSSLGGSFSSLGAVSSFKSS